MASSPTQKNALINPDSNTVVPANRRDPPLEGGHSTKIGGIWTLKHEISSQKNYDLPNSIEVKGEIALDINNFYNHINMCINLMDIFR